MKSPFAYQDITARMEETIRKGYWKADEATEKKIVEEYLESVNKHGVGCAEHTCGNPRLSKHVMERAKALGIPTPVIEGFQKAMESAIRQQISKAAQSVEDFVKKNEAVAPPEISQVPATAPSTPQPKYQGYLMDVTEQQRSQNRPMPQNASNSGWGAVWVSLPVLGFLVAWRFKRRDVIA